MIGESVKLAEVLKKIAEYGKRFAIVSTIALSACTQTVESPAHRAFVVDMDSGWSYDDGVRATNVVAVWQKFGFQVYGDEVPNDRPTGYLVRVNLNSHVIRRDFHLPEDVCAAVAEQTGFNLADDCLFDANQEGLR